MEIAESFRLGGLTCLQLSSIITFGYVDSGRSPLVWLKPLFCHFNTTASRLKPYSMTKTSADTCDWREMEWTCRRAPCSRRPGRNPAPTHTIIFITNESLFYSVQRGSLGIALACCKAGPSSNLGSHGGSAHCAYNCEDMAMGLNECL